jgi:epoxyqueuosine reductase
VLENDAVIRICAAEGLHHLATIPLPERLDPSGYRQLLADGVGELDWLANERDRRLDPSFLLPTARSVLCVAWHYHPGADCGLGLRRAAYAAGKDYHVLLRPKLGRIGLALDRATGRTWKHRACVDSAPLNERTLARLAGLGWIGRNALLIHPRLGSYRVLGFLLTECTLPERPGDAGADRCGTCHRCETACPTAALVAGRCLTERCISYLTIEYRGVIPRDLAERFAGWWFGCDACQDVCPWNRFAPPGEDARLGGRDDASVLLDLSEDRYHAHFAGRAIRRIGWERFRRNLLVALFSVGRLDEARRIAADPHPLVRTQAAVLGM